MKAPLKAVFFMALLVLPCTAWAVEYVGGGLPDPFGVTSEVLATDETQVALKLSGIAWKAAKPMAVINGKAVKVGDKLEDIEVIEITRDGVKLSRGASIFTLRQDR